ncbi:MAG: DUF362 domain-containing protein [Phycisphaerae bacterium]
MGNDKKLDRRAFLKVLAGGAVSTALLKMGLPSSFAQKVFGQVPATEPFLMDQGKSLVIRVRSQRVMGYDGLNRRILRDMIAYGLNELIGVTSLSLALKELFTKKDIIGFKFNSSGAKLLGTNTPLAEELLRLMTRSGYDPSRILFIEVQPSDDTLPRVGKVKFGWGKEMNFGSGKDSFACVLDQVTAMVNVGLLKTNPVAGMSGCLKNMAYGLIKHPARYHANHCTPYIADIYQMPIIRKKVRFNLLNALRVLVQNESSGAAGVVMEDNSLIFGHDVVAVDATGFEILDGLRKKKGFKPLIEEGDFPAQLIVSAQKGLGVYHPDQIQQKGISAE